MVKPKVNVEGQKELERVEKDLEGFSNQAKSMNLDQTILAPIRETESQTKLSQSEMDNMQKIYLKPKRSFPAREKFNEKFREEYDRQKEYVEFIAENNEVIGESADFWIKKFPGTPCEEWVVPVNKPVWAPRYVKERLEECGYTVFKSSQSIKSEEGITYNGYLEVQERRSRLNAREVPKKRNIYMGGYRFA